MSRSQKILGLVAKGIPGTVLCRDVLVLEPTGHILRGFVLETTSVKNMVYVWRVITPLHRPMKHPFLDYSVRINHGEPFHVDEHAIKESAGRLAGLFREHLPALQQISTPEAFLRHIAPWIRNTSFLFRLDLAFTYCRIERFEEAAEIVREIARRFNQLGARQQQHFRPLVSEAMKAIEPDPSGLLPLLQIWEAENVSRLELEASRMP